MKKIFTVLISLMLITSCVSSENENRTTVILPKPSSVEFKSGKYKLPEVLSVYATDLTAEVNVFFKELKETSQLEGKLVEDKSKANLSLLVDASSIKDKEGYRLTVSKNKIEIVGHDKAGVFYGMQSLLQLIYEAKTVNENAISAQVVEDAPSFSWRAFLLDEGRYFKGEEAVYTVLDEMAALKMNVFHWHLTEDAGWRIEIKKYPLLTEIGSKRKDTQVGGWNSEKTLGKPHSGFYTQEDVKRILKYAKDRHIKVVPEIEMPGHASAAIASYPWLGSSGKQIEVPVKFGKHYAIFNVANEKVQIFLKDVIDEVFELFETDVIHIGGDEVRFNEWETNAEVTALKKAKGFSSYMDVQIDFTNMMSRYIESKGARMMGWNEILGTNLHTDDNISFSDPSQKIADNIIVHYWKGDPEGIVQAAKNGYDVVNSHHMYTYIDYSYASIPLKKAYEFEPISPNMPEEYKHKVIGIGCQMWGEWTPEVKDVERMAFPRIAAFAEVGWTNQEAKDYEDFIARMKYFTNRWDVKQIGYTSLAEADK